MSQAILLRTMSRKSVFQAGRYENHSVQQLIDLKHTGYLRYVYFNMSMISFLPDILDEIGIFERHRIKKPGVDKAMHKKVEGFKLAYIIDNVKERTAQIKYQKHKKHKRLTLKRKNKCNRITKAQMQAKNHGK